MKYIAIIDLKEKPVCCEFIGCNGNASPYKLGGTTTILSADECFVGKWIPVSEGLPKEDSRVEITLFSPLRNKKVVRNGWFYKNKFRLDNGEDWNSYDEEILAWKYECEPYKAESED